MKASWFKRKRIFFIPTSVDGWVILALAVGYAGYEFISIDQRSHSVSDTLINFVFNALIITGVYSLIGYLASPSEKE